MKKENPAIGLDNVVIAKMLSDASGTTPPTYGTPIHIPGVVQASVNPNSSVETDYGDNGAIFVTDNRGNMEVNLEFTGIDENTKAEMLGQKKENGIVVEGSQDQSPYWALGFRVWIAGTDDSGEKIYKNFWLAKGKFSVPESGGETKGDGINFQHVSMVAQFVSTLFSPDGKGGIFGTSIRTDDEDANPTVLANWFNAPVLTTSVDVGAVTVAIAKGSTDKKITITGTKANAGTMKFAMSSAKLGETVIVTSSGSEIAGSLSVNAGGDIITFTSEEDMSGDVLVAVTNGLKDVNGVGVTPNASSIAF